MGARPEDYRVAAPPESYIHVDDFESPQELAKYLQEVGSNPDLYNSYFRWKGTGEFINTKFWCRLCAMVHYAQDHSLVYKDPHKWWHGPGICIGPSKGKKWSSWRGIDSNITYQGAVQYDRQVTGSWGRYDRPTVYNFTIQDGSQHLFQIFSFINDDVTYCCFCTTTTYQQLWKLVFTLQAQ